MLTPAMIDRLNSQMRLVHFLDKEIKKLVVQTTAA